MNDLERVKSSLSWDGIVFGEGVLIPSQKMIDEMIDPPKIDINLLVRVLNSYGLSVDTSPRELIEKDILESTYSDVIKKIGELAKKDDKSLKNYELRAYAFLLRQEYRSSQLDDSFSSFCHARKLSNTMVGRTIHILNGNTSEYLIRFCSENNIDYLKYQYCRSVGLYCRSVLPSPLRYTKCVESDYVLSESIERKFKSSVRHSDNSIPFPKIHSFDKKNEEYLRKIDDIHYQASIRFSEYTKARLYIQDIDLKFAQELDSFTSARFTERHQFTKQQKDNTRTKETREKMLRWYQCQFCYGYRVEEPSKKPSYHCGKDECKTNYQSWRKQLQRLTGWTLETLYQ
jgi:hypothetical protein